MVSLKLSTKQDPNHLSFRGRLLAEESVSTGGSTGLGRSRL